jgi:flagella basal body P-ring formation protein FlgA
MARALQERVSADDFTFKIPNQMIFDPKRNLIPRMDVERAISAETQKQCGSCAVRLREVKLPDLNGTNEDFKSWSLDFSQANLIGNFLAPIRVQYPSGSQSYFVTGASEIFRRALVTRRTVNSGDRLNSEDIESKVINATYLKGSLLTEAEVNGHLVARALVLGQPLVSGDVKREPAASRGQLMKVIAGNEELEVTMQAVAEETGFVGDLIRLKNSETQKQISGKILEKGVVKLQ